VSDREPRFNVDPETGELVEIDEELTAAIEERDSLGSISKGTLRGRLGSN
jgi:hypothetical protein